MGVPSAIASHPQKQKIIDAIIAGQPYRDITAWTVPPVGRGVLSRFKASSLGSIRAKITEAQNSRSIYGGQSGEIVPSSVQRAAMQTQASPFRPRIDQLWAVAERSLVRAESADDVGQVAPLINAAMRTVEVLGRATGELQAGDTNTLNVMVSTHQVGLGSEVLLRWPGGRRGLVAGACCIERPPPIPHRPESRMEPQRRG